MSAALDPSRVQKFPRFATRTPVDVLREGDSAPLTLWVDNISYGGLFVETRQPATPGLRVGLRVHAPQGVFGAIADVVHVLDDVSAQRKQHPPGMGLSFCLLRREAENTLKAFVDGLALSVPAAVSLSPVPQEAHALRQVPRFAGNGRVEVKVESRTELARLWMRDISRGGLFVEVDPGTAGPPLGARVEVRLMTPDGALPLSAEVVHSGPTGAGLAFLDLEGDKRGALERYLAGRALQMPTVAAPVVDVAKLVALVKRFFDGVAAGDSLSGIGLPETATVEDVQKQCRRLSLLFSVPPPQATPPQAARFVAAARALTHVEAELIARLSMTSALVRAPMQAIVPSAETKLTPAPPSSAPARAPPSPSALADRAKALIRQGNDDEEAGRLFEARRSFKEANAFVPSPSLSRRIEGLTHRLDGGRARDLLDRADVFLTTGMRKDAVQTALQAAQLGLFDVVLAARSLNVLMAARALGEALQVAKAMVERHRESVRGWEVILEVSEERDPRLALKAAEALCHIEPSERQWEKKRKRLQKELD